MFVFLCVIGLKYWAFSSFLVISCYRLSVFNVSENQIIWLYILVKTCSQINSINGHFPAEIFVIIHLIILSSFTVNDNCFGFLVNKLREFLQQPYTSPALDMITYTSNFHQKPLKKNPANVKHLVANLILFILALGCVCIQAKNQLHLIRIMENTAQNYHVQGISAFLPRVLFLIVFFKFADPDNSTQKIQQDDHVINFQKENFIQKDLLLHLI